MLPGRCDWLPTAPVYGICLHECVTLCMCVFNRCSGQICVFPLNDNKSDLNLKCLCVYGHYSDACCDKNDVLVAEKLLVEYKHAAQESTHYMLSVTLLHSMIELFKSDKTSELFTYSLTLPIAGQLHVPVAQNS